MATKAVKDALERGGEGAAPEGYDGSKSGWILLALQNTFCHLRRGATVEDALVATVGTECSREAVQAGDGTDSSRAMRARPPTIALPASPRRLLPQAVTRTAVPANCERT